jgi:hypothetical protein
MPNSTVNARAVRPGELVHRVSETTDARRVALEWLADQLRWEGTLKRSRQERSRPNAPGDPGAGFAWVGCWAARAVSRGSPKEELKRECGLRFAGPERSRS